MQPLTDEFKESFFLISHFTMFLLLVLKAQMAYPDTLLPQMKKYFLKMTLG
jgi:hypothetical protein